MVARSGVAGEIRRHRARMSRWSAFEHRNTGGPQPRETFGTLVARDGTKQESLIAVVTGVATRVIVCGHCKESPTRR